MSLHATTTGAGPDLVLLHGWGLDSRAWDEVRPALEARFRVTCIDLPGHGHSPGPVPERFEAAAALVAALVPEGAVLCGWSLGGLFALSIAHAGARAPRALVLVASTPCFRAREDWPHAMAGATLEAFAAGLHRDRDRTLRDFVQLNALHGRGSREAVRTFAARLAEGPAPAIEALEASLGWLRDTDLRGLVPAIATPTLVVHGTRDALAPIAAGRWLAANLAHATLLEIEDAAHIPFHSHREAFGAALEPFGA